MIIAAIRLPVICNAYHVKMAIILKVIFVFKVILITDVSNLTKMIFVKYVNLDTFKTPTEIAVKFD